ncbi:MAG: 50S ribosomal protein L5 [Deltaproteobacteria bacterium]|nr:MAG: 50S ribosomal protein L5 [Deltaproteobacteria bacterium]
MSTLKENYINEVVPQLTKTFNFTNRFQVPKLEKIVLNMGLGEAVTNPKIVDSAAAELALIAGQKPIITRSKKPIANFKLRADLPIGCKVTLRRKKMYDFFDRLVNIALPRVRDFRGISPKAFDGMGNYTLGITEHIIFPEIDYDKTDSIKGLNITIVTSAKNDEEGREFLKLLGMPFKN